MIWEDLLTVPYKKDGRGMDGMDCYGLVLELCRRAGAPLDDIVYKSRDACNLPDYTAQTNVRPVSGAERGRIVECEYDQVLHVGFLVDKRTVLHMTYQGVRVTPVGALRVINFFEVTV